MADDYRAIKEAAAANRSFYSAFEALDIDAMGRVWSPTDRVKCVHPGWEMLVGREPVMASWRAIFQNTAAIRFELVDLSIEILGSVAWITNIEEIRIGSEGEGRAAALATNLFEETDGAWRMVLHHASPLAR